MHVDATVALARDRAGDVVANAKRAVAFALALPQAASVSAVSPLWLITKARVSRCNGMFR
jgi:hypothetical protein